MENNINGNNKFDSLIKKEYNLDINPNIKFKEELSNDCYYDYYQISFNFDIYNLNLDKEKIFISYISKEDNKLIKIMELKENNNEIILTLNEHKNKISTVRHFFDYNNSKNYLISTDSEANLIIWDIISINEYKIKHKIESKFVRNRNYVCSVFNENNLFPGMNNKFQKFGCIYNKPFNSYGHFSPFNPMQNAHNMFNRNRMGMDMFDDFNYGNPMFKENPFVIDYIGYSLLFFSSDNTYILVSYRETSSIAIFDLETLESKGRLYDKSSVESLLQWYNSSDKINYLIISGYNMIEVINPFNKNNVYYSFKDQDSLKGSNYTHSIMYNFKDNNDYLLAYTNHNINILNLTLKTIISSIKLNNEIYSILPWNENYIIICQGKNFSSNQFTKISVVHIDSGKIITDIYISDKKAIKGSIKRLIVNNKIVLVISDSENKIKLWGVK